MLGTRSAVQPLTRADWADALSLCATNVVENLFVAARINEGVWLRRGASLLGSRSAETLTSLTYLSANIVPVALTDENRPQFVDRLGRYRARAASILGSYDQVLPLWRLLEPTWGPARAIRTSQPLMATTTLSTSRSIVPDPRVRLARPDEVDIVLPAAAHMFTGEIGYPPFIGSPRSYRAALLELIRSRGTYVVVEDDEVIFKADVGSRAFGNIQLQGVWLAPRLRGRGLAAPALAAVIDQATRDHHATGVSLYVNEYNTAARATYHKLGMVDVGTFATVLL